MLRLLLVLTLMVSACRLLPRDISPITLRVVNRTERDMTVRPAKPNEIAWVVNGPNEPVVLAPGASVTRSWGPDYDKTIQWTDKVTIEADDAQGIIVFCHRYTIEEIQRSRETIDIRDVDLEC